MSQVSVITVSFNTKAYLLQALRSAVLAAGRVPLELIVVDNGSSDGSALAVVQEFPEARIVLSSENKGFAWANNRGASEASGDLLLFVNSDVVFLDHAIETLAEYLKLNQDIGAVGPKVLNPDGSLQFSGKRLPNVGTGVLVATGLHYRLPWRRPWEDYYMLPESYATVQEVDHLTACCLMVRREVWDAVGGFDEGYFMYFEDIDWCLRARKMGHKLAYVPQASVIHRKAVSSSKRAYGTVLDYHRSARRFYDRYYADKTPAVVNWLVRLGIYGRMLALILLNAARIRSGVTY